MKKIRVVGLPIIAFGIVFFGVMSLVVYGLWNALMPAIFRLPEISYWQALGLFILSRALFGRSGGAGRWWRKSRFVRGWSQLTPEERSRFRRAMGLQRPEQA